MSEPVTHDSMIRLHSLKIGQIVNWSRHIKDRSCVEQSASNTSRLPSDVHQRLFLEFAKSFSRIQCNAPSRPKHKEVGTLSSCPLRGQRWPAFCCLCVTLLWAAVAVNEGAPETVELLARTKQGGRRIDAT
jgi:hypothetical protein